MVGMMHRNQSASAHDFAMVPRADIPRSSFRRQWTHKTTFDANYLIPVYCDEVLPGDTFSLKMTAFARMATPVAPLMDNLYLDSFFFFVPCRLLWSHWEEFMGQQLNPADSISFTVPVCTPVVGPAVASLQDYFGLPTVNDIALGGYSYNALPFRAYNLIWSEWFRDENLQNYAVFGAAGTDTDFGDGPDLISNYTLKKRNKAHDYFTAALPWTQKGGTPITIPLSGKAVVKGDASATFLTGAAGGNPPRWTDYNTGAAFPAGTMLGVAAAPGYTAGSTVTSALGDLAYMNNMYADLSTATNITINQLRQSFQIQKLLERDARGGTRYTEVIRAHFGVISPDARLQRPEYLGGGTTPVNIGPVPQTSGTGVTGSSSPLGTLGAFGTLLANGHGFSQSFTEHGYIIGLVNIRADLTYQRGLRKLWTRSTRYDFYFPAFAMLGEQAVLNQEIFVQGIPATDTAVFGYQERWAEYRYMPSMITGRFRSTDSTPLDFWHLSEKFTSLPTLSGSFMAQNTPMARVIAYDASGETFLFDSFFDNKVTRPMPMYSVPGLIDHF